MPGSVATSPAVRLNLIMAQSNSSQERTIRQPGRAGRALLWMTGTDPHLAARAGSRDVAFHQSLGALVALVGLVATASAFSVLSIARPEMPWWCRAAIAALFGVFILFVDRALMATPVNAPKFSASTELGRTQRRDRGIRPWLRVLPSMLIRMMLAGVIAAVMAEPLLVGLFSPEIYDRITTMRTVMAQERTSEITDNYAQRIENATNVRDTAQTTYGGTSGRLKDLKEQREAKIVEVKNNQLKRDLEIDGTGAALPGGSISTVPGRGPRAAGYDGTARMLQNQIDQLDAQISRLSPVVDDDKKDLEKAQATLGSLQEQRDAEVASARNEAAGVDGLFIRLEALEELIRDASPFGVDANFEIFGQSLTPMQVKAWALRGFLFFLDTTPILIKTLHAVGSQRGLDLLTAAEHRRLKDDTNTNVFVHQWGLEAGMRAATAFLVDAPERVTTGIPADSGLVVNDQFVPLGQTITVPGADGSPVHLRVDRDANGTSCIWPVPGPEATDEPGNNVVTLPGRDSAAGSHPDAADHERRTCDDAS